MQLALQYAPTPAGSQGAFLLYHFTPLVEAAGAVRSETARTILRTAAVAAACPMHIRQP